MKHALDQALLLRGSRNFTRLSDYRSFVAEVATRLDARVIKALSMERVCLKSLPQRRTSDYEEMDARVSKFAPSALKSAAYSMPSRLVGHRLRVRLYEDPIEGYLGEHCVLEAPRLRRTTLNPHHRHVDFRHVLPAPKRKPGALVRWQLRDAFFPRSEHALSWQHMLGRMPEQRAAKLMVGLLKIAADGCDVQLALELQCSSSGTSCPILEMLTARLRPRTAQLPTVIVVLPARAAYNALKEAA